MKTNKLNGIVRRTLKNNVLTRDLITYSIASSYDTVITVFNKNGQVICQLVNNFGYDAIFLLNESQSHNITIDFIKAAFKGKGITLL